MNHFSSGVSDEIAFLADSVSNVLAQVKTCIAERGFDLNPEDPIATELNMVASSLENLAEVLNVTNHYYFGIHRPDKS